MACRRLDNWIFASPFDTGRKPCWPGTILEKIIRPAARELGIRKRIGWHTHLRGLGNS